MFFFDERYATFEMFTVAHLIPVLLVVLTVVMLAVFRRRIRASARFDRAFRIVFAVVPVAMEWIFYAWATRGGGAWPLSLLPFGLCAMSMYLTSVTLLTKSEKLRRIIYPWAVVGALLSLVVADVAYTFPHFRYLHYFGNHGMFLIANVYMMLVAAKPYTYRDVLHSSLVLFLIALPMYFLDRWIGMNHLYLVELPAEVAPMFMWMGEPWWVFGFGFAIFFLIHLVSLPFLIRGKRSIAGRVVENKA